MNRRDRSDAAAHLDETIETVAELERRALEMTSLEQRRIERTTIRLGRPTTVYVVLVAVLLWAGLNALLAGLHQPQPDPPPFFWLATASSVGALIVTLTILTAENRMSETEEQRARLHLQISLLAERKTAKIIALLEELRYDLPTVPNRDDREAQALTLPADPHEVAEELEKRTPPIVP